MHNVNHKYNTLTKFQGSIVGVLIGDCLGKKFEGNKIVDINEIKDVINNQNLIKYSDDTAFTFDLAKSLIENKGVYIKSILNNFTITYYNEPERGYGNNIGKVMQQFKSQIKDDLFGYARQQFDGEGSFGNGSSMRITPLALLYYKCDSEALIRSVIETTLLTHSHPIAIYGALCQALVLAQAILLPPPPKIGSSMLNGQSLALETLQILTQGLKEVSKYEGSLLHYFPLSCVKFYEENNENSVLYNERCQKSLTDFLDKFETVKEFLMQNSTEINRPEIIKKLGNDVSAVKSVPTSIYFFLRALKIAFNKNQNAYQPNSSTLFLDTLYDAISLGGDTDTIASMTGALLGSWLGYEIEEEHGDQNSYNITSRQDKNSYLQNLLPINTNGSEKFEKFDVALSLSSKLYHISFLSEDI
ncbi:unnamed protein product [Gordionus sp. m RMFG-2023]